MKKEENIAEFIGIMLGDGSIGIYDTKAGEKIKIHRVVKISLDSRNKGYLDYIINLFRKVLDTTPRIRYKKKENAVDVSTHKKDRLSYVLNELGLKISPKWGNMEIPKKYRKGKLGLLVLKGIFDTDGCLSIFNNNGILYPRIEIRLCPSPAQSQIKKIFDEFNFKYKIQELEKGKTRIRLSGKNELKKWFDLIGSSNPIHIKKSKKFLN